MTDEFVRTLVTAVTGTLLAFELVVALKSWLEVREVERSGLAPSVWFTRPVAIRDHFAARQRRINAIRWQFPTFRSGSHGHDLRDAIRHLRPVEVSEVMVGCLSCRGSRLKGRPHCRGCGRRLVAPAHESWA